MWLEYDSNVTWIWVECDFNLSECPMNITWMCREYDLNVTWMCPKCDLNVNVPRMCLKLYSRPKECKQPKPPIADRNGH